MNSLGGPRWLPWSGSRRGRAGNTTIPGRTSERLGACRTTKIRRGRKATPSWATATAMKRPSFPTGAIRTTSTPRPISGTPSTPASASPRQPPASSSCAVTTGPWSTSTAKKCSAATCPMATSPTIPSRWILPAAMPKATGTNTQSPSTWARYQRAGRRNPPILAY